MTKIFHLLLLIPTVLLAQTKNNKPIRYSYDDKTVAMEFWKGSDTKLDSAKTYHKNGKVNESIYYDDNGYKNGVASQFDKQGQKLVTWTYSHGKLVSRTDHHLPFNKEKEADMKETLQKLQEINTNTNFNPTKLNDFYKRANLRSQMGNYFLALEDFKKIEYGLNKAAKNNTKAVADSVLAKRKQFESRVYDNMARIYESYEMENHASHYFVKAMALAPKDTRIIYNFSCMLQRRKMDNLAEYYLNIVIAEKPTHSFARWSLAKLYSDQGKYQKAMDNITIAFENEQMIINRNSNEYRNLKTTRGLLYHKLGDSEKGIQDLKQALEVDEYNSYAMKNLGIIYLDQEKYEEACALFQKAKALDYTLVYDEYDLGGLIESACNRKKEEIVVAAPKPYIYPNPATTTVSIRNYDYENFEYALMDFEGKTIYSNQTTDGSIDVSRLNPGYYIIQILNAESPQTFRLIKK